MSPAPQQVTVSSSTSSRPTFGRERLRRGVELLRRQRGEAALVVGDLPHSPPPASALRRGHVCRSRLPWPWTPCSCSSRESARSPWTMPSAPSRPCSLTRSKSARDSLTPSATCGGKGGGTLPCLTRPIANFISLIDETMPCVFGTSSVSRSQPVVFADVTNQFACFAPMSRSIPSLHRLGAELRDRVARVDALGAALVAEVAARALPDPVLAAVLVEALDLGGVARVADEAHPLRERLRAEELGLGVPRRCTRRRSSRS